MRGMVIPTALDPIPNKPMLVAWERMATSKGFKGNLAVFSGS
jgi:hypothetical protein